MAEKIEANKGSYDILKHLAGSQAPAKETKPEPQPAKKANEAEDAELDRLQRKWLWAFSFTPVGGQ